MQAPRALLEEGLAALGLALDAAQVDRLMGLADLVVEWNGKFNLTAITEPVAMVQKHLLDSLTVRRFLRGPRILDVGTGAGFPGLPLAIACPDLQFVLVDSIQKKIRFVEHAIETLGLSNATAVCSRVEALRIPACDTIVSRALSSVADFVAHAGPLLTEHGCLLAMKGRDPTEELVGLPRGFRVAAVERLAVPGLEDARHVVVIERSPRR